jgi:hypothetical protein
MPGCVYVHEWVQLQDLVQFRAGIANKQKNEVDTLPGKPDILTRRFFVPLAEGLFELTELDCVEAGPVVRGGRISIWICHSG